ncbi:putative late blight resistance protein homolog R1A-10 [Ipomoea triloba]|uniref:putative late blight resistance protein homolog R1A-10 n=1 Tax=Ipomoea triloba TaxID=35885 RepID=UPI00125D579D|nr:putative late blight resistance protein homolog R1A-10 [Ipomoea triloba]
MRLGIIYDSIEGSDEAFRQKHRSRLRTTLQQAIRDTEDLMRDVRKLFYSPVQDFPTTAQAASSKQAVLASDIMEGRGKELGEIMDQLIHTGGLSRGRKVISILGMGGIGKTTLARRVYEDPLVLSYFDILGWTVVSQTHDVRKMLLDLLQSIDIYRTPKGNDDGEKADNEQANIDKLKDGELTERLRKCLMGRRYLIVLDDIWSISAWEDIHLCFPDNCGSRILLTTRHKEVADSAADDDSGNNLHTLGSLNSQESWNLFCKNFPVKQGLPQELETIGRHVVDKCNGLPLAIVVVAGVLSKLNRTVEEWQVFENQTNSLVVTTDLKDEAIIVKRLIRLWIAEGFVELINSENLEDMAHGYLQDLVDRSLILIQNRGFNGEIKTCRMHNIVHDFCVREAIKEKLLNNNVGKELQEEGCRWLNFWPKRILREGLRELENMYVPRSILYLHTSYASSDVIDPMYHWSALLRVMELHPPISIGSWAYPISLLRYINICLQEHYSSRQLENYALYIVREKLQTLYWLRLRHCTEEVFSRIPNVRKLGISCQPQTNDDDQEVEVGLNNILDNLHHLNQLETLKIAAAESPRPRYICLRNPQSFPGNLKELTLVWTRIHWEHISTVIGCIPSLEVLKLKHRAARTKTWEPSEGGFCRLKFLLVESCQDFKYWKASADHYPVLERIVIRDCPSLKEIPSSFVDMSTLRLIELNHCCPSLVTSAKQIQEDQQDIGNEQLIVRAYNTMVSLFCSQHFYQYRSELL